MGYLAKKLKTYGVVKCVAYFAGTIAYLIVKPIYKVCLSLFYRVAADKYLFLSNPSFSDNSKVLYNYMVQKSQSKGKYVWLIWKGDKIPSDREATTIFIRADSYWHKGMTLRALKEIYTSQVIFYTHRMPDGVKKRKGQKIINLWHGCGYKDTERKGKRSSWFDFALVPGEIFVGTKAKFWNCPEEKILPIGYPRFDLLKGESKKAQEYAKNILGEASKLIIWLPTFRRTAYGIFPEEQIRRQFDLPLLTSLEEMKQLNSYCKEKEMVICLKRHPFQLKYSCEEMHFSHIHFIDNRDLEKNDVDLYSLLPYTDGLITDYSSVAVDYLLLDRPMAFILDDLTDYKNTRGFVFQDPTAYMPGKHVQNLEDLYAYLEEIWLGADTFWEKRHQLLQVMHNPCENYCERILETLKKIQNNRKESD